MAATASAGIVLSEGNEYKYEEKQTMDSIPCLFLILNWSYLVLNVIKLEK